MVTVVIIAAGITVPVTRTIMGTGTVTMTVVATRIATMPETEVITMAEIWTEAEVAFAH